MLDIPDEQPTPDPGTAGLNKGSGGGSKPKPEKAAGGGGGGREEAKPASFGKVPQASLDNSAGSGAGSEAAANQESGVAGSGDSGCRSDARAT